MQLVRAFGIRPKEVVAFVGGGGKTTAMFRLAEELVAQGKHVVTTTTTRIFAAQLRLAPEVQRLEIGGLEIGALQRALARSGHVLVVGNESEDGKAFGIDPALVQQLIALDAVDAVLIEADGSRMRPFKAPAEHEPVIPECATLVVPIVGIEVVGKLLDNANVHRVEQVARLAGIAQGTTLTAEHVARVIGDAQGGLKNTPVNARVIPFLNKVETETQLAEAQHIARLLLQNDAIDAVVIGSLHNQPTPVARLETRVATVILAAGGSTRMQGQVKQLLPWGDTTFVGHVVRVAQQAQVFDIVVVTGNRREDVTSAIADAGVRTAHNPDWASGRASSVRVGIGALDKRIGGAIFINADQPFLTAQVLDQILNTFFETGAPIVVPTYKGKTGSPVLFARELFDELNGLRGEQGGRDLMQNYSAQLVKVEIEDVRAGMDLDTPEDYQHAVQRNQDP